MKLIPMLLFVLTASSVLAQSKKVDMPPILERLCGKLEHVQDLPVKNEPHTFTTKTRHLSHVRVSVFPYDENGQCCEGLAPLATALTGHWGAFEFKPKQLPGGLYWLQVEPNGRKYKMAIRYVPKRNSDELCSERFWAVSDVGDFWEGKLITVE